MASKCTNICGGIHPLTPPRDCGSTVTSLTRAKIVFSYLSRLVELEFLFSFFSRLGLQANISFNKLKLVA